MSAQLVCGDILQFQEQLKRMRDLDDKVIYALNNSLPTASIQTRTAANPEVNCKGLYDSLRTSYFQREKMIQECITYTAEEISRLKQQRDESSDVQVEKKFKSEQRKLRVLKTEQTVEEIVKERTLKALNERCRQFFRVENF